MTPDEDFLQAIIENPDDDAPRLVFADYLEEHGEPERAEFIRLQCTLARTPADDGRRAALEARERELLASRAKQLAGPLSSPLLHWHYRRGLIDGLAHAGLFQRTEAVEDDEGYRIWSYLRFYGDGQAIFVASDGTPEQVSRWFRRGYDRVRRSEPATGHYCLRQVSQDMCLSFSLKAGYGVGFGLLDFKGTVEVGSDLFNKGTEVKLVLDVHQHNEKTTIRQVFKLVELPGYDSEDESLVD